MFRNLFLLVLISMVSIASFAATVQKVKGKSVLIDMKGDAMASGDMYYAVQSNGKRSALIKIAKIKGDKALGKIVKGSASPGMNLEAQPSKVSGASGGGSHARKSVGDSIPNGRSYWGALFGYGRDSMDVNVNDSTTGAFREKASLSGSGFSAKGLFDYEVFPHVWFRFTTGLEMFKTSGGAKCGQLNQQTCDANINYLTLDFVGRGVFSEGVIRPWLGGGVGLLFPMSKEATALQSQSISTTNVLMVLGGVDYFVTPNFFIPASIEYGMLPKSDEVEASWIGFRVGFGMPF